MLWIGKAVNWLDGHQGSAVSLLTFVLVGVTVYYAIQTRRTVLEMEKQRKDSARPIIYADWGHDTGKLKLMNRGPGVALHVTATISGLEWGTTGNGWSKVQDNLRKQVHEVGALQPGGQEFTEFGDPKLSDYVVDIQVAYQSVYGDVFNTLQRIVGDKVETFQVDSRSNKR